MTEDSLANKTKFDKLPPETFESYLKHVTDHPHHFWTEIFESYLKPVTDHPHHFWKNYRIQRMGGQSTGIRLIIEMPYGSMSESGQRYIAGPDTVDEAIHVLNWSLWLQDKQAAPQFSLKKWKITAGPKCARITIWLDREK